MLGLFLVGGFKHILFSPIDGMMIQSDYIVFFRGVETTNQVFFVLALKVFHRYLYKLCLFVQSRFFSCSLGHVGRKTRLNWKLKSSKWHVLKKTLSKQDPPTAGRSWHSPIQLQIYRIGIPITNSHKPQYLA